MRRRWLLLVFAALLLLALGIAVGRQTAEPAEPRAQPAATVTVTAPDSEGPQPESAQQPSGYARTPEGAVGAATAYIRELAGPAIVDPAAVRTTLTAIASDESRDALIRAYELAAQQTRERLGIQTASDPDLVLRTAAVGYRVDGFHPDAATVSIWRLGIVGSGTSVEPSQSWRTETVSVVWEDGTWKLDAVRSSPGPTPPLAGRGATPPADLAAAIPAFEAFAHERP